MELKEISATIQSPYRCYVRGNIIQTEGDDVYTVGFKDGLAVVQVKNSTAHIDKMQICKDNILDKTIDLTKLKKIIVKVDPQTGKKYILKDGRKIEILPQLHPINLKTRDDTLQIKTSSEVSKTQEKTVEDKIRSNIIIKNAPSSFKNLLKGGFIPKVDTSDKIIINKQATSMKVIDNIKYHVLNLNVKKPGLLMKSSVATMTDCDGAATFDKSSQTDSLNKRDFTTQTDFTHDGDSPFSEHFFNFILGDSDFNDRNDYSATPRKMIDPSKLKTKEEINKFNFFNDMRCALNFDRSGNLPIHESVMQNNMKNVQKNCVVLKAIRENVNILNQQGFAPLHLAILHNVNVEIVKILLNHGADISIGDPEGNTALHLAIENNCSSLFKVLVATASERGFNFDVFNHEGFTPLILACLNGSYADAKLLLQHGADPNVKDMKSGRTALFHAAENHDVDLVQLLIEYKADTKIRNFFGTSAHDAMFEVEDMPLKIKFCILGRDHQRFQNKKKVEGNKSETTLPIKKAKLETTPVLKKVSSSEMIFKPRRK